MDTVLFSWSFIHWLYNVIVGSMMSISVQHLKSRALLFWGCKISWKKVLPVQARDLFRSRNNNCKDMFRNFFKLIFNSFQIYCAPPIGPILEDQDMLEQKIKHGMFQHSPFSSYKIVCILNDIQKPNSATSHILATKLLRFIKNPDFGGLVLRSLL